MFSGIFSDLMSDIVRKTVRTIITLSIVGTCVLGVAFATGKLHPNDLRPENVRKVIATCQERMNPMKGIDAFGATESPYGTSDLGNDDGAVLAGNY